MERRKFTREFKLEAVRPIRDRGVSYVQASHTGAISGVLARLPEGEIEKKCGSHYQELRHLGAVVAFVISPTGT